MAVYDVEEDERLERLSQRLAALESERKTILAQMGLPQPEKKERAARHGQPWTTEERTLISELFTQGMTPKEIAAKQERSAGGIRSELIRLGLIEAPESSIEPVKSEPRAAIPAPQSDNHIITDEFKRAFELLENSQTNLFLTGKAGTGKSTFLQYFREHTRKKMAVVAPTGVAALNVGAQTIHSFFRLKPGLVDLQSLKPSRTRVLRNLELLVIDEISMVRADMFEAMDYILRRARRSDVPFGGVQICAIGDLFQLPPVVTREEKAVFEQRYPSPFFFDTNAYKDGDFTTVQFTTIHRQKDAQFIEILNSIRSGSCGHDDLEILNNRVSSKATPAPGTLVLTSTNSLADEINARKLGQLSGKTHAYEGDMEGEFGLSGARLPAPQTLLLKVGAQVMFVKNDTDGRWVNGTIGLVEALDKEEIIVRIADSRYTVERENWTSLAYELEKDSGDIVEKELGSYTQFPLTLAWAITIHKSQGKTLERVIIDLGSGAFAPGQLYVALSRCKSLAGIALKQPVTPDDIVCDPKVVEFMRAHR